MEKEKNPKSSGNKTFMRFAGVGMQMAVVIGGFTWLGSWLDGRSNANTPIWTIVLSLSGVFISMYLIFKEVKKLNDVD